MNTIQPQLAFHRGASKRLLATLLVGGLLAVSLSAWAGNPVVTDSGQFVKIQGKQFGTGTTSDEDIAYVRKSELVVLHTSNNRVEVTTRTARLAFDCDSPDAARAVLKLVADFASATIKIADSTGPRK